MGVTGIAIMLPDQSWSGPGIRITIYSIEPEVHNTNLDLREPNGLYMTSSTKKSILNKLHGILCGS